MGGWGGAHAFKMNMGYTSQTLSQTKRTADTRGPILELTLDLYLFGDFGCRKEGVYWRRNQLGMDD